MLLNDSSKKPAQNSSTSDARVAVNERERGERAGPEHREHDRVAGLDAQQAPRALEQDAGDERA